MIPEGKHLARGRVLALKEVGKNNSPMVEVAFELASGEGSVRWGGFLTEGAEERTIESLRHMGWTGSDIGELERLMDAGKLSNTVQVVVKHREYNGKTYPEVRFVNGIGGRGGKKLEGAALNDVAERIKSRLGGTSNSGRAFDDEVPLPDDSELPF